MEPKKINISLTKLIIIIATVAVIGIGAVVTIVKIKDKARKEEDIITEENNEKDTEEQKDDEMKFWLNTAKWPSKTNVITTLFNEKITLPIKLDELDEVCAPYRYWAYGQDATNVKKIQEILGDTTKIDASGEVQAAPQIQFIDGKLIEYKDDPCNIEDIYIRNFSKNELSTAECYNKGWWYLANNFYPMSRILNLNMDTNEDSNQELLINKILEKLGAPTYIEFDGTAHEIYKKNQGRIGYELVYEYDEYVITIYINETISSGHSIKVNKLTYYTTESWKGYNELIGQVVKRVTIKPSDINK